MWLKVITTSSSSSLKFFIYLVIKSITKSYYFLKIETSLPISVMVLMAMMMMTTMMMSTMVMSWRRCYYHYGRMSGGGLVMSMRIRRLCRYWVMWWRILLRSTSSRLIHFSLKKNLYFTESFLEYFYNNL